MINSASVQVTECIVDPPVSSSSPSMQQQSAGATSASTNSSSNSGPVVVTMLVEGMSCGSCAARIEKELQSSPIVASLRLINASVNFAAKKCRVEFAAGCDGEAAKVAVCKLVQGLGYEPVVAAVERSLRQDHKANQVRWGLVRLLVDGMSCASCATRIEDAVHKQFTGSRIGTGSGGVESCLVNFATSCATIRFASGSMAASEALVVSTAVKHFIEGLGYKARVLSAESLDAGGGGHMVRMDADDDTAAETRKALERTREIAVQRQRFLGSLVFTIPLVCVMVLSMSIHSVDSTVGKCHGIWLHVVEWAMATPVVVFFGQQFFRKAWMGLKHKTFTMDTLIAVGVGASYGFSMVSVLIYFITGDVLMVYFDAAATLTTFMLLGRFLEATAKRHTSGALIQLLNLVPPVATVLVERSEAMGEGPPSASASPADTPYNNGTPSERPTPDADGSSQPTGDQWIQIPTSMMYLGQRHRVLAGDRFPTDGTIASGSTEIDEQLVTGESLPRVVVVGDNITGGALNLSSTVVVAATRLGDDTTLANILRIVQDAQGTKPAIQRIADAIAGVFVPIVVGFGFLVLVVWTVLGALDAYPASWRDGQSYFVFAFSYFIATVVVACPCALGLATPTAVMVGTGVGAAHGVLIKSGALLEVANNIDCVVFDKTGTLTKGSLEVVGCEVTDTVEPDIVRLVVAAVEEQSTHPIAKAVHKYLTSTTPAVTISGAVVTVADSTTYPGLGVAAIVQLSTSRGGRRADETREITVAVGSLGMMTRPELWCGNDRKHVMQAPSAAVLQHVRRQHEHGRTAVVAAVNGVPCIVIGLADGLKDEAVDVVAYLQHERKLRVLMVSGDHHEVANHIAHAAGIHNPHINVFAEVLPEGKAAIVKKLQDEGHRVAFVGDGINDSPALAQADVGVALGAGTEIAIDAADVVLMRSSLVDLCTFLLLARTTVRRIKANFVWALGYNLLMLPFASGVLYPLVKFQLPPVVAGIAMIGSSLTVLCSSLHLRCFKPPRIEAAGGLHSARRIGEKASHANESLREDQSLLVK